MRGKKLYLYTFFFGAITRKRDGSYCRVCEVDCLWMYLGIGMAMALLDFMHENNALYFASLL